MSATLHPRSLSALKTRPFLTPCSSLSPFDWALLSYQRAEVASYPYDMSATDLLTLSPKFWDFHMDPIIAVDGSAFTIMTIQYNLCAGTLARYAAQRRDLVPLVEDLLRFRKYGQFLLTEIGHGIDMGNLETTVTLLPDGSFELHTPTPNAGKFMPPTVPAGRPCVAIVFARLLVSKEDRGIHPFLVSLNDGFDMCKGVRSRLLPDRGCGSPVNHSITYFNHVRLPPQSLLGSVGNALPEKDSLVEATWRVAIGALALGCLAIPMMQVNATIGIMYSLRRHVGPPEKPLPIFSFRTQQIPILTAIAQATVMQAFARWAIDRFCDTSLLPRVRHGLAAVLKAVTVQHSQAAALAISERCGAQGLFTHNQISAIHATMRGVSIAEGDILALSIRLVMEILQGRYALPPPQDPSSLLARHEAGLFQEKLAVMSSIERNRSEQTNQLILPYCQSMVEAMGHRMAYEAALADGLQPELVDLYVVSTIKLDAGWYIENTNLNRRTMEQMETQALDALLPHAQPLVRAFGVEPYISAPIVSDEKWDEFVDSLEIFQGEAEVSLFSFESRQQPDLLRSLL